jgi:peptidoglycan/LPS O-acetylase OafA/YrhL
MFRLLITLALAIPMLFGVFYTVGPYFDLSDNLTGLACLATAVILAWVSWTK